MIAEPESFLVTKQDRLEPQETSRARDWGAQLAASVIPNLVKGVEGDEGVAAGPPLGNRA